MPAQGTALGIGSGVENSNALKGQNRFVVKNLVSPFQGWADSHNGSDPQGDALGFPVSAPSGRQKSATPRVLTDVDRLVVQHTRPASARVQADIPPVFHIEESHDAPAKLPAEVVR
jgi:hypothetical protein